MHTKHMFDRGKMVLISFGGYIYIIYIIPHYNSNFQCFEIKSIVRALQDSTVYDEFGQFVNGRSAREKTFLLSSEQIISPVTEN